VIIYSTNSVSHKEFSMKKLFKLIGIIAIVAVIGFSMFACGGSDDDNNNSGTDPTITTASLPNGTVGTAYSQTLTATGDTPITWSIDTGALPAGLSLATTGVISGTPTTATTSTFTVKATNAKGSNTKSLSITIAASSSNSGGTLTLTNIPSEYNGKYISGWSQNIANPNVNPSVLLIGGQSQSSGNVVTILISNGSANIPLWTNQNQRYTDNHTVGFIVQIIGKTTTGPFGEDLIPKGSAIIKWGFNSVTFSNGNATKNWTDGEEWK
jgi:hypothetical protein